MMSLQFHLCEWKIIITRTHTKTYSDNAFRYVTLPVSLAKRIVAEMNRAGTTRLIPAVPSTRDEEEARVARIYKQQLKTQWAEFERRKPQIEDFVTEQMILGGNTKHKGKRLGWVTEDACPGDGDDIKHIPGK
jgi:K+/H+ antiporter YhaU regulatory subunit KhtT